MCGRPDARELPEVVSFIRTQGQGYEEANSEFKDYGFDYHTQGSLFSSAFLSCWVTPKGYAIFQTEELADGNYYWFCVELEDTDKDFLTDTAEAINHAEREIRNHTNDMISTLFESAEIEI